MPACWLSGRLPPRSTPTLQLPACCSRCRLAWRSTLCGRRSPPAGRFAWLSRRWLWRSTTGRPTRPSTRNAAPRTRARSARPCDVKAQETEMIAGVAKIHDLGKMNIWPEMLNKAGPLDDSERLEMNRHPAYGAEILAGFVDYRYARDIILHHHERFDGNGYPAGLKGEQIPLGFAHRGRRRCLRRHDLAPALSPSASFRAGRRRTARQCRPAVRPGGSGRLPGDRPAGRCAPGDGTNLRARRRGLAFAGALGPRPPRRR